MSAKDGVKFLIKDHGDISPSSGLRDTFEKDNPYLSLLQRNDMSLDDIIKEFNWDEDDQEFLALYNGDAAELPALMKNRSKVHFCVCATRELKEDFERGDVSCLNDLRLPLITSRTPLMAMQDEFNEQE